MFAPRRSKNLLMFVRLVTVEENRGHIVRYSETTVGQGSNFYYVSLDYDESPGVSCTAQLLMFLRGVDDDVNVTGAA